MSLNECKKSASGMIITPRGRLSYAQYLYTARENQQGKLKYGGSILLPPECDLTLLKNEMGKLALEKLDGDKARAKQFVEKRFLDPNNLPSGGKPAGSEFEGWTLLRGTSDDRPGFIYGNKNRVNEDDIKNEVYSGRWARLIFNPYWSDVKSNPGVMLGLQNVQLLDHADALGAVRPDAQDEFDAVEAEGIDSSKSEQTNNVDDLFN